MEDHDPDTIEQYARGEMDLPWQLIRDQPLLALQIFRLGIAYNRQEMAKSKYEYPNRYAVTINAGSMDGPSTTDCSQIVDIFTRVCATKQLKNCRVSYAYEAYTKADKEAPRTEDNLKRTFPHIHVLIESHSKIHKGTLQKTTQCITDFKPLKGPKLRWLNYLKKDKEHGPTKALFAPYLDGSPHNGVIQT